MRGCVDRPSVQVSRNELLLDERWLVRQPELLDANLRILLDFGEGPPLAAPAAIRKLILRLLGPALQVQLLGCCVGIVTRHKLADRLVAWALVCSAVIASSSLGFGEPMTLSRPPKNVSSPLYESSIAPANLDCTSVIVAAPALCSVATSPHTRSIKASIVAVVRSTLARLARSPRPLMKASASSELPG
eukprot:7371052-Prymnesium_polylepis.1